ncbi:MAG: 4Fe-4S dicluster domain-containing protein [Promethearchaeota archaeon]
MSRNIITNVEFRREMLDEMVHGGVLYCYQCNVCTENCPVYKATGGTYNPRQNLLLAFEGLDYMLFGEDKTFGIWGCTVCDTCDEKCPQKIELTAVFQKLKEMSVAKGEGGAHAVAQIKTIRDFGKAIPLQPAIERRREQMGLPKVPELDVEAVKKIISACGLDDLLNKEA